MRVEHDYDVSPRALLDVLTDEAFLTARSARFGGSETPSVTGAGDHLVVRVPRQLPVEAVPGPFRGMIGDGKLTQIDTWSEVTDNRVAGAWSTEVGDAPIELNGAHEITATAGGCRYVVTAKVKVRVRFIGGQAEGLVRQRLRDLVAQEQEFAAAWLAGARE